MDTDKLGWDSNPCPARRHYRSADVLVRSTLDNLTVSDFIERFGWHVLKSKARGNAWLLRTRTSGLRWRLPERMLRPLPATASKVAEA